MLQIQHIPFQLHNTLHIFPHRASPSNKAPLSGNVERNLTTEMNVSDYLRILIFLKAPSTRPLKNRAPGGSIRWNTTFYLLPVAHNLTLQKLKQ